MVDCLVYGADDGYHDNLHHMGHMLVRTRQCACTDAPVACGDDDNTTINYLDLRSWRSSDDLMPVPL